LEDASISPALDSGVHFASLSGHGSPCACCAVSSGHDFINNRKYFVAYANSCSTARPDGYEWLAEKSTDDTDGIHLDRDTLNCFRGLPGKTGLPYQNLINLYPQDCAAHQKDMLFMRLSRC